MRIRGSAVVTSNSTSSYAASSTNYFTSSSLDSPSSSPSSINCITRCEGLDILAEAVQFLAGSALPMGIPVTRRRVTIRRKSAFKFSKIDVSEDGKQEEVEVEEEMNQDDGIGVIRKPKKRKRVMAVPSKYQDSVLQPWKRQNRQNR